MNNITTLQPKEGVELLTIVVDKDAYDFELFSQSLFSNKPRLIAYCCIIGIKENYSILGTVELDNISFDCDELVESSIHPITKKKLFRKYKQKENVVLWTLENSNSSFISLLEANNINLQELDKQNKKIVILQKLTK